MEVKSLLLNWYIVKFPIPQRVKPTPRHMTEGLRKLAQNEKN